MVACMIIVPALAMFSHRLPAHVRATVRSCVWEPVETWVASLTKGGEMITTETVVIGPKDPADTTSHPPADATASPVAAASAVATPPAAVPSPVPAALHNRSTLATLGAVAVECRPFDGARGTFVASCRVAVDESGQLHRVFQAAGQSPDEALTALEQAVRGWQSRRETTARVPAAAIRL